MTHDPTIGSGLRMLASERLHQVRRHHRCQQTRNHERGHNREHSSPTKLLKKLAWHTIHKRRRQKNSDQRECCRDHRHANFIGRIHGCLKRRFTHLQMTCDVFNLDDRIIDQNTDDQGQRRQCDHIEGEAEQIHPQKSRQDRQGQRSCRHDRRSPIPEEIPHHQYCQNRPFVEKIHRRVKVFLGHRNVIDLFRKHDIRIRDLKALDHLSHIARHSDLVGAFATHDFESNNRLSIDQCD